jgi:hypothetical protein
MYFFIPMAASPVEEFRIPPMSIAATVAAIVSDVRILQLSPTHFPAPDSAHMYAMSVRLPFKFTVL